MHVTPHGDHLMQLTRLPRVFPVNCYLVREDDGFTLVDTALPGSGVAILKVARSFGTPIIRIVLTHTHSDHAGALDELHALLPDAEVLIGERDAPFLIGDMRLEAGEPQAKIRGSFARRSARSSRLLVPGDRVGSLEAVASPGHTPGHLALLDQRDGTLIGGDAFQTRGGIAVAGVVRPLFPFPAMGTWHLPTAVASARQLRALTPSRLAVGHGRVLDAPLPEMDCAIAAGERKVGNIPSNGSPGTAS